MTSFAIDKQKAAEARKRLREELHILLGPAEEARIERLVDALVELIVAVSVEVRRD